MKFLKTEKKKKNYQKLCFVIYRRTLPGIFVSLLKLKVWKMIASNLFTFPGKKVFKK